MYDQLINQCLHFPVSFISKEKIANKERDEAKKIILRLLGKNDKLVKKLKNQWVRHLINATVISYRRKPCIDAIEYIIKCIEEDINPKYFPAYNFVFLGATATNGLLSTHPLDVASQLIFKKHEEELTNIENRKCISFLVLIKEIFAVSQLIKSDLYFGGSLYITHLYNIIDKFNELFRTLFNTNVFDIYNVLISHKETRNAIAHAHFVIDSSIPKTPNNEIVHLTPKLVKWEWDNQNREYYVKNFVEEIYPITVDDIRKDLLCLCVFICQFLLVFQYLKQII